MAKAGTIAQGKRFLEHVVPAVLKPLRALWNEIIAFAFFAFSVLGFAQVYRAWSELQETGEGLPRVAIGAIFAAIMLYYGVSSYLRARKISKS